MITQILYTYITTENEHLKGFTESGIKVMKTSVENANKWYKTKLFCDKVSAKKFLETDIPFTEIHVLDELENYPSSNWGLAKLITLKNQTEPHIHIDLDTIITKKLTYPSDVDILWGYSESDLRNGKIFSHAIKHVHDVYYTTAAKYEPNLLDDLDFSHVVNGSLMVINNPDLIHEVVNELQDRVEKYFKIPSSEINIFIDQFLFQNLVTRRGGQIGYLENLGSSHLADFNKDIVMSGELSIDEFIDNSYFHFERFETYTDDEIDWVLNKVKL